MVIVRSPLRIEKIGMRGNRPLWQLTDLFAYRSVLLEPWLGRNPLVIPAGFVTDLASVPQVFLSIIGEHAQEASIPHDYLYQFHGIFERDDANTIPRGIVDTLFHELMGVYGPEGWRRTAMYRAVRIAGWHTWNQHLARIDELNAVRA